MPAKKPPAGTPTKRKNSTPGAIKRQVRDGAKVTKRAMIRTQDDQVVHLGKTQSLIATGQEDLTQWDDEELAMGRRRDSRGNLSGRKPIYYTRPIFEELVRRTMSQAHELMRENTVVAIQMLVDIVKGGDVEDKDRLKAIDMILNRVLGKEPIKVEVGQTKSRFEEFCDKVLLTWDEDDAGPPEQDNVVDVTARLVGES